MNKFLSTLSAALVTVLIMAGMAFVIGVIVMVAWNASLPPLFRFPEINVFQALGLFLLTNILFNLPSIDKKKEKEV